MKSLFERDMVDDEEEEKDRDRNLNMGGDMRGNKTSLHGRLQLARTRL